MRQRVLLVLSIGFVSVLAACGGSQPTISAPPQGFGQQQQPVQNNAYSILHDFAKAPDDGTNPSAELIDLNGTLYGTTEFGGVYGSGTAFSITKSGKETVLHNFGAYGDGGFPVARLLNVQGTLYGTTSVGGAGEGTVFSITPAGKYKVLHSFPYYGNGFPRAGLIDVNGTLYGTTSQNFWSYVTFGSVFSITTNGRYKIVHLFHVSASPEAALLDVNGTLYGTTTSGGKYDNGSVFSISPAGKYHTMYTFGTNQNDGLQPMSALIDVNGTLYGTTSRGGPYGNNGTIFSITTDGKENTIHAFRGSDGSRPVAGLIDVRGVLYGTTSMGGVKNVGTIFKIKTSGEETVLHSFSAGGGENPQAGLLEADGTLYGTTYGIGQNHGGNVFSLTP